MSSEMKANPSRRLAASGLRRAATGRATYDPTSQTLMLEKSSMANIALAREWLPPRSLRRGLPDLASWLPFLCFFTCKTRHNVGRLWSVLLYSAHPRGPRRPMDTSYRDIVRELLSGSRGSTISLGIFKAGRRSTPSMISFSNAACRSSTRPRSMTTSPGITRFSFPIPMVSSSKLYMSMLREASPIGSSSRRRKHCRSRSRPPAVNAFGVLSLTKTIAVQPARRRKAKSF